ncbi:MAG TPA: FAD-dependent oxidoreductase [Polyangiaceae bacterium]|nr:FAD-dependent oxidoreductase [Polyangiaceae bacterium]
MAANGRGTVAIVGGGVAGLSAAHELGERGIAVSVFEKRAVPGGKARSTRLPTTAAGDRRPLPGEHGFRFFPGFYVHLPDTMARIPVGDGSSVADHLHAVDTMTFAFDDAPTFTLPAHRPKNLKELGALLRYIAALGDMGITSDDLIFIAWQLWRIITSCEARRIDELEKRAWWDYVDASNRSEAFQRLLVIGVTRNLVASKAEKANARTVGQVGIQLLIDLFTGARPTDRILDGPTNDVWIDPWVAHLTGRLGVAYELGWELDHVELDREARTVRAVILRSAAAPAPVEPQSALLANVAAPLDTQDHADSPALERARCEARHDSWRLAARERRAEEVRAAEALRATPPPVETRRIEADHFILALPVEVMADLVTRQPELVELAPKLSGVEVLGTQQVEWMNGIQFYLTAEVPIARGHINHVDSPWALTSISQSQFWPDFPASEFGDGRVRTILSVDISAWDVPAGPLGKEAWDCDFQEVAAETWRQLKRSLNRDGEVLSEAMLHPTTPWHIDDDITERVQKERLLGGRRRAHRRLQKQQAQRLGEPDLLTNAEPLLVNLVDSWDLRPPAAIGMANLFVASDYVQTNTNLATMEAANEAARAAVNGVLSALESPAKPCAIHPLGEPFAGLRARDADGYRPGVPQKNPVFADALAFLTLFVGVSVVRLVAWMNAVPKTLWLLMGGIGAALFGFSRIFDQAWTFTVMHACGASLKLGYLPAHPCLTAMGPPSAAAAAQFWYAAYMTLFGVSLFLMPRKTLGQLGFPDEHGPWIPILGVAPLLIASFYTVAAVFDLRLFFWLSVFGRTGVFLYVLWLTEGRHRGSPLLLMVAVPDLMSAMWSGSLLAANALAGRLLVLGLANVVVAFAFQFFPEGSLAALGFPRKASAWVPMAAILLFFWGVYDVLAVVLGLQPLVLAGVVCQLLFAAFCVAAPLVYRARSEAIAPGFRLVLVGATYGASAWWLVRAAASPLVVWTPS